MSGWSEQVTAAARIHHPDIIDPPPVAHWSEQYSYKVLVGGSIPPRRTIHLKENYYGSTSRKISIGRS